jgi:hypothetical protein
MSTPRHLLLLAFLPLLLVGNLVQAESTIEPERWRLSGFGSLWVTGGDDEALGVRRDLYMHGLADGDASLAWGGLLGLQLDGHFTDQLGGAIQLVGRDRLDDSLDKSVEWAYLRYQFTPEWQLRMGRIGLDIYLLSEYRSVGFSYLWTRPPSEFYTTVPFQSFEGADLTWSRPVGGGQLRAKIYGGETSSDLKLQTGVIELNFSPIYGVVLTWESDVWHWRIAATTNKVDEPGRYFPGLEPLGQALEQLAPLWPQADELASSMIVDGERYYYYGIGVGYNRDLWQVQAELGRIESSVGFYPLISKGYLSVGRQVGPVTLYSVVATNQGDDERTIVSAPPPPVNMLQPQLQSQVQDLWDGLNAEQHTFTLGLRWDVRYDLALKLQWDHSWVDKYGTSLWQIEAVPEHDIVLDTFTLTLNGIF